MKPVLCGVSRCMWIQYNRTYFTDQTLNHVLSLLCWVIHPITSAKLTKEIGTIFIAAIRVFFRFMQRAMAWNRRSRTVTRDVTFCEQFELVVVCMTRY